MSTRALKSDGIEPAPSEGETRPDEMLVAAAIGGDELAFDRLVSRHRHSAFREAARIVGSSRADDVVHDARLLAHRALGSLKDPARFSRWLVAITRWLALRAGRPESRQPLAGVALEEPVLETLSELATAPRRSAAGNALLFMALEGIPPEYAEVVRYHFVHGLSHEKIAGFLGIPISTVKWRCFRGKELLRGTPSPEPACAEECRKGCVQFSLEAHPVAVEKKRVSLFEAAAARLRAVMQKHAPGGLALLERLDVEATAWMAGNAVRALRISLGVIFFWFGVLKFFPGLSPAQELATKTISGLTFGLVPPNVSIYVLAIWECVIGLGLIFGVFLRATLGLLFLQMIGTFSPLVLFPQEAFTHVPNAPTLEGQYIIKNLVLVSAGLVIGGTLRGGAIEADPEVIELGHQTQTKVRDA
jgi:RNA polymerase sigma factor (sigma-70 family)